MANNCYNDAIIHGDKDIVAEIKQKLINEDGSISVVNLNPETSGDPEIRIAQWDGVNRPDYDGEFPDTAIDSPETLMVRYETAWGPFGNGFWEKVTSDYPVSVMVSYHEDWMGFMGVAGYSEGKTQFDWQDDFPEAPEGLSDDEAAEATMKQVWEMVDEAEYECEDSLGWIDHGTVVAS